MVTLPSGVAFSKAYWMALTGSGTAWSAGLRTGSLQKHSQAGSETGIPALGQTVPPPADGQDGSEYE